MNNKINIKQDSNSNLVRTIGYALSVIFLMTILRTILLQDTGELRRLLFAILPASREEQTPIFNSLEFDPEDANPFNLLRTVVFTIFSLIIGFILLH